VLLRSKAWTLVRGYFLRFFKNVLNFLSFVIDTVLKVRFAQIVKVEVY
jgi:hypothetical protein